MLSHQSSNQTVNQSVKQSSSQSTNLIVDQSNQSFIQCFNQPSNENLESTKSIGQLSKRPTNHESTNNQSATHPPTTPTKWAAHRCPTRCSQILRRGLTFCEYSETLLIKAVKQEERAGNLDGARELLSRLKHVGIENVSAERPGKGAATCHSRAAAQVVSHISLTPFTTRNPFLGQIALI